VAHQECVFLDTDAQFITDTPSQSEEYHYIDHGGWFVAVAQKEINKAIAAGATKEFLSPLSFLYIRHKKDPKPHRLLLMATEEYIYMVTFDEESRPAYYKIVPLESNKDLVKVVERFLKEFYAQERSYFIEEVVYYRFYNLLVVLEDELEQNLGLQLRIEDVDPESDFCHQDELKELLIAPSRQESQSFWRRNGVVLAVGIVAIVLLVGYDIYLRYDTSAKERQIAQLVKQQVQLANQNNAYTAKMLKHQKIDPLLREIDEKNALLEHRIRDLFALVPNDVYLTYVEINKGGIVLRGMGLKRGSLQEFLHKKLAKIFAKKRVEIGKAKGGYMFEAIFEEAQ